MLKSQLEKLVSPAAFAGREPVKFSAAEKKVITADSNLYAAIIAIDSVERLYSLGTVSKQQRDQQFELLIPQLNVLLKATGRELPVFMAEHGIDAPYAKSKLQEAGNIRRPSNQIDMVLVLESGQHFVTLVDALKMGLSHADELLPVVRDLYGSLSGVGGLAGFKGTNTIKAWYDKLSDMKASESLHDEDVRQFSLDLDVAFGDFHAAVKGAGKLK